MSPFVLAAHSHNSRFNVPLTNSEKWSKGNSVWHSSNSIRNRKWQFHHRKKELSLKSVYKNCFPGQLRAWDWSVRRYLRLWWFSSLSGGGVTAWLSHCIRKSHPDHLLINSPSFVSNQAASLLWNIDILLFFLKLDIACYWSDTVVLGCLHQNKQFPIWTSGRRKHWLGSRHRRP